MRPRRVIMLATLIGLGVVAMLDVDVYYEPELTMPEAHVGLSLPASLSLQPTDVARAWAVPVEAGIRAVGDVTALGGSVSTTGLELTARFTAGTDVETKVARIQSELEPLRARLPEGSHLFVSAETVESGSYLAVTGDLQPELVRQIERELSAIPSVRAVRAYGGRRVATTLSVNADRTLQDDVVRRATEGVRGIGRVSRLGSVRIGKADVPVYSRGPVNLRDVRIGTSAGVLAIDSVVAITRSLTRPESAGRYDGRQAVVIGVQRDSGTSLLKFDRELREGMESIRRRLPAGSTIVVVRNEAEPLERLLVRTGAGFLVAMLVLAGAGWLAGGRGGLLVGLLVLPVALSLALNAIRLTGLALDVTTIPAIGLGLLVPAAILLLPSRASSRHGWAALTILCGAALPISVTFAAGPIATFLIAPAKAFAIAMASVAVCLYLFPTLEESGHAKAGRALRAVLRASPTVMLIVATTCYAFFVLFGSELDPRKSSVVPDRGRIFVSASFPEGTTLEQAEDGAARLEEKIGLVEGVGLTWGQVTPARINLVADVLPDWQSAAEIEELASEIRYRARLPFGQVIVRPGAAGSRGVGARSIELEPEANDDGLYVIVLEGDDIESLELSVRRISSLVWGLNPAVRVLPEWGTRSVRFELRPVAPQSQSRAREVAALIAARAMPPTKIEIGRDDLFVVRRDHREDEWVAPPRTALMESPLPASGSSELVPVRHLQVAEEVVAPTVPRQSGRFAVRARIAPNSAMDKDHWLEIRKEIDRRLAIEPSTDGSEMHRPEIRPFRLDDDGMRLVTVASIVPLILVLISTIWSNSLWRFLPFVLPPVLGVAATTPVFRYSGTGADEISLLMLAGACFGVLALTLAVCERLVRGVRVVVEGYRSAAASAVPVLGAAVACAAFLAGSTIGTDAATDPWVSGSRIAGVAVVVALPASVVLPAAAFFGLESLRRRRTREAKAQRRPVAWAGDAPISLEVRHVSKTYRGGFRALRDVSFDLQPGIVGLLGPNGAGKTTLLRVLTGLLLPSRGQVIYRGQPVGPQNIDAFREHIGFLPQSFNAYPGFTAEEFVDFWAMQAGITDRKKRAEEVDTLIAAVGLEEHARRKVRDFSGGMRQRIGIARALIGQPDLLVVDEPTTGLDIEGRSRFRGLMLSVAAHRVVVLSTHIAGDVEATCSRVLLIHQGQLRFDGTPDQLIAKAEDRVFEMTVDDHDIAEISSRYRLTRRVRVLDGIRVKGVVPSGESLPGPVAQPGLEEAYLAEIELADVAVGRKAKFTFLIDG